MSRNRHVITIVPNPTSQTPELRGNLYEDSSDWDAKWLHPQPSVVSMQKSETNVLTPKHDVNVLTPKRETMAEPQKEDQETLGIRFLRWLFPEVNMRRAKRFPTPGLVAYYWTGGAPHSFHVGDMSATGLFLLTKERWAPGTLIQMTLQQQDGRASTTESSICVLSEVVRWGEHGSGFNFILTDYENVLDYGILPGEAIDRKSVERFMKRIGVPELR